MTMSNAFKQVDTDGDGRINSQEFMRAMQSVHNAHSIDVSIEDTMRLFRDADMDRDGVVDYSDFVRSVGGEFTGQGHI